MNQNAIYLGADGEVLEGTVRESLVDEALFSTIEKELNEIGNGGYFELHQDAIQLGYEQGGMFLSTTEYEAAKRELKTIFASALSQKEKAKAVADMDLVFINNYLDLLTNTINGMKKKITYLHSNKETKQ